ncbi:phosphate ABC transporter substrate-binding protein PstS [Actinokineospora auranticolor]|uniref:Phosphate ABC transporter phosphate-binding protein n=1 Tax=Actinokineospora auranticolor TaxID=155976 RepID=A0A2S6GI25_9PSEU|nr:phosphate ABC transporter substrate-binding protein PstS [Actinokineospora auranticolor]PPK64865.1 phosphate ABC transporter phosphate-binding protein [Actinokineospora auranticolor]
MSVNRKWVSTVWSVRFPAARRAVALGAAASVVATVALASPAAAQPYEPIRGSGSTWSANALGTWIGDVSANGIRVNYEAVGSTRGRTMYAQRQTVFGVSEIPFQQGADDRGVIDDSGGRAFGYMPIVAGGTAFMYNVKVGGQPYRGLRLSTETVVKIFTGAITNWNDPQITRDNNGFALPARPIIPVVRSDGSGTTAQFTTFMDKRYPDLWRPFFGRSGLTSYYPNPGNKFIAQNGSDAVAGYVSANYGDGAIGYVEYSYAKNKRDWPVAKILNEAGYYTLPTDYNVAVALTKARIETQNHDPKVYLTQILDGVYTDRDPRTYPLSSYSYMIVPAQDDQQAPPDPPMTREQGRTLSAFAFYFLCEGQQKAGALGYSPLPLNLVQAGFDQVKRIPGHEERFLDPSRCNNPTFDPANPSRNVLAERAPNPPDCDATGKGPCREGGQAGPAGNNGGGGGGGGNGNRNNGNGANAPGANNPGTGGTSPGANGNTVPGAGGAVDPETGLPVGSSSDGAASGAAYGTATELAAFREDSSTSLFGGIAALELLVLLVLPALVARAIRRRRQS